MQHYRVLAVEDDPGNKMVLSNIFRLSGCIDGVFEEDGSAILDIVASNTIDLVLMDITLTNSTLHGDPAGGTAPVTAVWGSREPAEVSLDSSLGAGRIRIETSYPLDKFVALATPHAASVKPYWSRHWHDGEDATWSVTYRWLS